MTQVIHERTVIVQLLQGALVHLIIVTDKAGIRPTIIFNPCQSCMTEGTNSWTAVNTKQQHSMDVLLFTLRRHSSSGILAALCLLTSLLHDVQKFAFRGCGWKVEQGASLERWIWFKSSTLVTGMSHVQYTDL